MNLKNIFLMNQLEKEILVFKTDLESEERLETIKPFLDEHPGIIKWNVDKHDIDKVLRIESKNISSADVINLVQKAGFVCEELPD
jgi:hypothetical protein